MQMLNVEALTGYSAALDALTQGQRAALVEIVFCYRLGSLSATAVFGEVEALRDVAGQVPAEIERAVTRRYGVDLESLAAGQARFYVDGDDLETVLLGFTYSAARQLEEWKRYRQDADCKQRLLIDRFDAANEPKSIGEVERAGGPDLWNGPRDLPEKAKQAGFRVIYLAKDAKDQCYLRLLSA
ncbi:hypothetical protein PL336_07170 [Sulfitobacter faviae]|uniref:Uncharacterized protein n=1 Tax=Sulfitobacter faviae TaxID=1775881 RepID=A0AAX3LS86_9RHOB|nr:hypothetical protein [Sulfitobacter faviae]WCE71604.1 hypothetical protein PL336_07170 [Sulfitobacter faviae]